MKIVKFLGGLGNQMFQYSFYLALNKKFNNVFADLTEFESYNLHNGFELQDIFGIQLNIKSSFEFNFYNTVNQRWIWRKLRKIYPKKYSYTEELSEFNFDESIFQDKKNKYYWGYWQHINYVNMVSKELRNEFIFPPLNSLNQNLIEQTKGRITVSIHVRRGDYLNIPHLGNNCDKIYYNNAIKYMKDKFNSPLFVVFSNDIPWCKEAFDNIEAIFVDWNHGKESFRDMQLMSLCDHNIIANSSFSWWGAWLNKNPEKTVVSPKQWIYSTDNQQKHEGLLLESFVKL